MVDKFHQDVAENVQRLVKRYKACSALNQQLDPIARAACPQTGKRSGEVNSEELVDLYENVLGDVQKVVKRYKFCAHSTAVVDPIAASLCAGKRAALF